MFSFHFIYCFFPSFQRLTKILPTFCFSQVFLCHMTQVRNSKRCRKEQSPRALTNLQFLIRTKKNVREFPPSHLRRRNLIPAEHGYDVKVWSAQQFLFLSCTIFPPRPLFLLATEALTFNILTFLRFWIPLPPPLKKDIFFFFF